MFADRLTNRLTRKEKRSLVLGKRIFPESKNLSKVRNPKKWKCWSSIWSKITISQRIHVLSEQKQIHWHYQHHVPTAKNLISFLPPKKSESRKKFANSRELLCKPFLLFVFLNICQNQWKINVEKQTICKLIWTKKIFLVFLCLSFVLFLFFGVGRVAGYQIRLL